MTEIPSSGALRCARGYDWPILGTWRAGRVTGEGFEESAT